MLQSLVLVRIFVHIMLFQLLRQDSPEKTGMDLPGMIFEFQHQITPFVDAWIVLILDGKHYDIRFFEFIEKELDIFGIAIGTELFDTDMSERFGLEIQNIRRRDGMCDMTGIILDDLGDFLFHLLLDRRMIDSTVEFQHIAFEMPFSLSHIPEIKQIKYLRRWFAIIILMDAVIGLIMDGVIFLITISAMVIIIEIIPMLR